VVQLTTIRTIQIFMGINDASTRWSNVFLISTRNQAFAGLGFVVTRVRNVSLLAKWIMKLDRGDQVMSCQILRIKYCT
jgi:hypothetical protein